MEELVEYIARSLVDHPDSVRVERIETRSAVTLELTVADSDMGRVIGRRGRVVNAMRSLVDVVARNEGKRVSLEIID
ncbi:MAG: KH domain-containing protein [Chloroflexota bacterium]|nr:KH domain-containing protein [Candidatus Sulfomarinibacteraceae bacterium]